MIKELKFLTKSKYFYLFILIFAISYLTIHFKLITGEEKIINILNPLGNVSFLPAAFGADKQITEILVLPGILRAWGVILALANTAFVLFLLFVAFANILRFNIDTYTIKKILPSLIMGAVLANFSLLICRLIVEASAVMSNWILLELPKTFASTAGIKNSSDLLQELSKQFGLQTLTTANVFDEGLFGEILGALGIVAIISLTGVATTCIGAIVGILFLFFVPIIFFWILIDMFYIRYFILLALAIVSPLACFSIGFPMTEQYFKKWWDMFIKWAFMPPVTFFVIWLGLAVSEAIGGIGAGSGLKIMSYLVLVATTYYAAKIPMMMGGGVMKAWTDTIKKGGGVVGKGYGSIWAKAGDKLPGKWGRFFQKTNLYGLGSAYKLRTEQSEKDRMNAAMKSKAYEKLAGPKAAYLAHLKSWGETYGFQNSPKALAKQIKKYKDDYGITDADLSEILTLPPTKASAKDTEVANFNRLSIEDRAKLYALANNYLRAKNRSRRGRAEDAFDEVDTDAAMTEAGAEGGQPQAPIGQAEARNTGQQAASQPQPGEQSDQDPVTAVVSDDDLERLVQELNEKGESNEAMDEIVRRGADRAEIGDLFAENVNAENIQGITSDIESGGNIDEIIARAQKMGLKNPQQAVPAIRRILNDRRLRTKRILGSEASSNFERNNLFDHGFDIVSEMKRMGKQVNEQSLGVVTQQLDNYKSFINTHADNQGFNIDNAKATIGRIAPALASSVQTTDPREFANLMGDRIDKAIKGLSTFKDSSVYQKIQSGGGDISGLKDELRNITKENYRNQFTQEHTISKIEQTADRHFAGGGNMDEFADKIGEHLNILADTLGGKIEGSNRSLGESFKEAANKSAITKDAFKAALSDVKPVHNTQDLRMALRDRVFINKLSKQIGARIPKTGQAQNINEKIVNNTTTNIDQNNTGGATTVPPPGPTPPPSDQPPTPPSPTTEPPKP